MPERATVSSRSEKSAEAIVGNSFAVNEGPNEGSARHLSMWETLRLMPARAGRSSVEQGEASFDLDSGEADCPRQTQLDTGKPQLLGPPGADPHARWCGRGRSVSSLAAPRSAGGAAPSPIVGPRV
jgi:hypothetical protein